MVVNNLLIRPYWGSGLPQIPTITQPWNLILCFKGHWLGVVSNYSIYNDWPGKERENISTPKGKFFENHRLHRLRMGYVSSQEVSFRASWWIKTQPKRATQCFTRIFHQKCTIHVHHVFLNFPKMGNSMIRKFVEVLLQYSTFYISWHDN